jgi:F-type H+-transporting ATPase subunit gamma
MSNARDVRSKIGSVKNTRKVTRALEMVSASKIRKVQDQMAASRPYAQKMANVMGHMAHADPEYRHPYLVTREEPKRVGYILVSTDRGLCGGLNTNLFKALLTHMRDWHERGCEIDVVTIGRKGSAYLKHVGVNIVAHVEHIGEKPVVADLIGIVKVMLDAYREGTIDRLFLVFNDFVNTMTQRPMVQQLLPAEPMQDEKLEGHRWDYIYEPGAREVLDAVLDRYIESLVYQGVVENLASEHAARMVAMKAASDNANELIDQLQLVYNKARQAAITQELSEIVGGAAAV